MFFSNVQAGSKMSLLFLIYLSTKRIFYGIRKFCYKCIKIIKEA